MLATADIVERSRTASARRRLRNVVIDPVMAAAGLRTLLTPDAVSILKARLLPLATVVTPNVAEAAALSGMQVDSMDAAREAARRIAAFGPRPWSHQRRAPGGARGRSTCCSTTGTFTELAAPRADQRRPWHGMHVCLGDRGGARTGTTMFQRRWNARRGMSPAPSSTRSAIGHGARVPGHFGRGLYS